MSAALLVGDADFVTAIAGAIASSDDPLAELDALAVEDLYLARACVTGSPEAMAAFTAMCRPAMVGSLRGMGLASDVVVPLAGQWQLRIDILVSDFELLRLQDAITLRP